MHDLSFLNQGGVVGGMLRDLEWSASPFSEPEKWPLHLRLPVQMMLESKTQMFLTWGEEYALLYNDAYLPVLGDKHPCALGQPMKESWGELWDVVAPLLKRAMAGESLRCQNHPFTVQRNGRLEDIWANFSYTPIRDLNGKVHGVLCLLTETTSGVRAEQFLKRETQRLYQLFEDAPGFMALLQGPDHVYELINKPYRQLIGQREIVGRPIRQALPELTGQGFFELLDQVFTSGCAFVGHRTLVKLQRSEGAPLEERCVDFVFQPVRDKNGEVSGIFVQGNDVTSHIEIEKRWREAAHQAAHERERLNALLNTVPVGIIMADATGQLVEMTETIYKTWGKQAPLSGQVEQYGEWKGWWADSSERHGQAVQASEWTLARALAGEEDIYDIIEIEPFDQPGVRRTIINSGAPIRDTDGNITGAVVAGMDVTAQMRAEADLRVSEAKFRAIANAMPQIVWSNLPDGEHDFYNARWYEYTGLSNGLRHRDDWQHIIHPEDREQAALRWQESLQTGKPYEIEYRLLHAPSGKYRWTLSRALPINDDRGSIMRWMGTTTDIHNQKLATEELRLANSRKDEFLAMLAHELRNPLAPIAAAADLLMIIGDDQARVNRTSEVIARQVKHMTDLIDDLLDVSRVTRGLVELEQSIIDVKQVIASAIEQARPLIEARRHTLHVHLGAENALVYADRTRLIQVIANVLNNAAKYTAQGGSIEVILTVSGQEAKVSVTDNGSGIESSLLPHVFEIFTQGVRTPDRAQGGLGLGLALVKSIMDLHGGRVEAHSEGSGQGSTFSIYIPVTEGPGIPEKAFVRPPQQQLVGPSVSVIIVDDNLDAAHTLGALLEAKGHYVCVMENPKAALEEARINPPRIFILDIGLPDMDGYELARQLRAQPETAHAVLIALTGYGQAHDKVLAKGAGFDYHFVKPIDIATLDKILARVR